MYEILRSPKLKVQIAPRE